MNDRHVLGSFLFGVGVIEMLDGIVFHQLLQWHSVYMPTGGPYQIVSDGLFHLFVTIIIFIGSRKNCPSESRVVGRFFSWGGNV